MWSAVLSGLLAVASMHARERAGDHPRLSFAVTEEGGGLGIETHNSTAFFIIGRGAGARWVVERSAEESNWCGRRSGNHCEPTTTKSHQYLSTENCPALQAELSDLAKVRVKERSASHPLASDTPLVSLVTYGGEGMRAERIAEYGGPLTDWWRQAQPRFASCWRSSRPPL